MSNDFWSNGYWNGGYFPDGYFGVDVEAPEGSIAAALSGAGTVDATLVAAGWMEANLSGSGTVSGDLSAEVEVTPVQQRAGSSRRKQAGGIRRIHRIEEDDMIALSHIFSFLAEQERRI